MSRGAFVLSNAAVPPERHLFVNRSLQGPALVFDGLAECGAGACLSFLCGVVPDGPEQACQQQGSEVQPRRDEERGDKHGGKDQ